MDLAKKFDRTALKSYFLKNATPTASNFADLIEGMINQKEDGIAKPAGEPLSVQADGDATSQKKAINFYKNFTDPKPAWTLSLNPRVDPNNPATARPGWSISDADGNSKLFIDQNTGNVGIGTASPAQRLHVPGGNAIVNNVFLGEVGHGSSWAGFCHSNSVSPTGYGFLHHVNGQYALINKKSGGGWIGLRIDNADKLVLDDAGNVGIGTTTPRAKLEVGGGAIMPTAGNGASAGIQFPSDPGGGGGDAAWLRFYARQGEACTLELGVSNDGDDHIALMASGCVGIGTTAPNHKFHVVANDAVGLFESTGGQAYLRLSTNEGIGNRVEITNRPGGRLSLWTAGAGDIFNITKDGNVGIGTTGPATRLDVRGTCRLEVLQLGDKWRMSAVGDAHGNDGWLRLFNVQNTGYWGGFAAGELYTAKGSLTGSDLRLKEEVSSLRQGAQDVLKLRGVRFKWRDAADGDAETIGLIAQEVEQVFPEVVRTGPDGMKGINYPALIAPLIEALKDQQAQIGELRAEMRALGAN
jgi:Chaperone of endosialidase